MAMTRRYFGVLVLGFVGAGMTGACGSSEPSDAGALGPGVDPPDPTAEAPLAIKPKPPQNIQKSLGPSVPSKGELGECSDLAKTTPCMRYYLPLLGNPHQNAALRDKYKAAFGDACYSSDVPTPTFGCFYKKEDVEGKAGKEGQACTDAKRIADIFGAASYAKHYKCLQVSGTQDYWLQVGSDPSIKIDIKLDEAPLETSLIDVNGVPTAINGPYRNVPEPPKVEPGRSFWCASGQVGPDGRSMLQRKWILEVNKKAHGGVIHSDLADFTWPCNEPGKPVCTEETELLEKSTDRAKAAQVHHVVRASDLRGCAWGTNSNKNAVVISAKLNNYLSNKYPTKEEVDWVNKLAPYTP